ncbi:MAG: hypothetical protein GY714_20850 [Desulfobacterales bacterium]|nr:hypothetical protein [Desulfobacterales bacterium]
MKSKLIAAAILIKNNCVENGCKEDCPFYIRHGHNKCKLGYCSPESWEVGTVEIDSVMMECLKPFIGGQNEDK